MMMMQECVCIEDLCKRIYAGGDVPKDRFSEVETEEFKVPIYANAEKDEGLYGYTDEAREYEPSVTVAARGTIGYTAIRTEPFLPVVRLITVVPKLELIDLRYMYYALKSCRPKSSGTSIPQLTVPNIKKYSFRLPSKNEQISIASKLDLVQNIIDKRKKELEELDNLIKSRFVEMFGDSVLNPFGWKQTTLKEVAVGKLSYGSGASATEYDGECRYVRITDITDSGELNDGIKSPDKYDEKYLLRDGDVLFARSGATVGKTFRYSEEKHGKSIYAGYLIRLIPDKEKVLADYVFYYTKTEYYASFVKKAQRAVAQPNINAQEYGDLIICVPPIYLQKEFMAFVNRVDKLKFSYM